MPNTRRIALLFPGQGSQHPGMAVGLYGHSRVFTSVMDEAFDHLGAHGETLRAEWLDTAHSPFLDDVTRAQPLLYAVEFALGRMVLDWGVRPAALLGHSVGEMVAATLAGTIGFADGIRLMLDRVHHYAQTPPGGMLAVAAPAEVVEPHLHDDLAIAALNSPQQTLVAGRSEDLLGLAMKLRGKGVTCLPARARQAFHSPVVADAAVSTIDAWRTVALAPPRLPLYSAQLCAVLPPERAVDPVHWAMGPAEPVHFWPTLDLLLRSEDLLLVEIGPGQGLTALANRHRAVVGGRSDTVPLLPVRSLGPAQDREAVACAAGRLAAEGHALHRIPTAA